MEILDRVDGEAADREAARLRCDVALCVRGCGCYVFCYQVHTAPPMGKADEL